MKKIGFTLMEVLVALSLTTVAATTTLSIVTKNAEEEQINILSNNITDIMNGFDKRVANDSFELEDWVQFEPNDYSFHNRSQVYEFLSKALIAKDASGCGEIDGWVPEKDDPDTEDYKDKLKFIPCSMWKDKMPLGLNSSIKINHNDTYVNGFELNVFFDDVETFEENFLLLKQAYLLTKNKSRGASTGVHQFDLVDKDTDEVLSTRECVDKKLDCVLRASFTGSNNSQDYLLTNGNNNMIGSKVKFQPELGEDAIQTCHRYENNSGSWSRVNNVYCGVGLGYSDPNDTTSDKLDYVEVAVDSISTNRIFLDSTCSFEGSDGAMRNVPCGIYNDEGEDKVIATYDAVYADDALISVVSAVKVKTNDLTVNESLTSNGTSTFNGTVEVNGEATFNDLVNINGESDDINLIVNTSASLKDVTIDGFLSVEDEATFKSDLNVSGDLKVNNKLETKTLKLNHTITSSSLGADCSAYGEGTVVYFKDSGYSDLALCANNKWKLSNIQENQVVAFNGSCPAGFSKFTEADGRALVGAGSLKDNATGNTLTYSVGDVGGEAYHVLTIDEMPSHNHQFEDAYYVEVYGPLGAGSMQGSGDTDNDNNLYTRSVRTTSTGGSQAHENRMPYYVVNWCVYGG